MKPFVFLALGIALASTAHSAIIIGNLAGFTSDTTNGALLTGINYNPATPGDPTATPPVAATAAGYGSKAIGFTMSSAYSVTSLTLRLNNLSGTTDAPSISIYTSNGSATAPATLVGTFTNPTTYFGATPTNYVFTPTSAFNLAAGVSYFVVVQELGTVGSDSSFTWQNGSPTVTPTGAGAIVGPARFGGGPSATAISSASSQYNWFELSGNAIPEPSAPALLSVALISLASRRKR